MMTAVATTADKVRRLRRRKMWTQEELAKNAGVAASTVVYIEMGPDAEKGTKEPRFSTLKKLAKALEVNPVDLLED
jgi:transcriptional regulator with XRE-family HTH domain